MLFNNHLRRRKVHRTGLKARLCDAKSRAVLQPSTKFVRTYNAKAHEITDAITAVIINADAGLHLLRAQSPDLEEVRASSGASTKAIALAEPGAADAATGALPTDGTS
jgi:hypothetical protein